MYQTMITAMKKKKKEGKGIKLTGERCYFSLHSQDRPSEKLLFGIFQHRDISTETLGK